MRQASQARARVPRAFVPAVLACALLTGAAIATRAQTPIFKSGTTLVRIDVTATDRDGAPVADLAAGDFMVTLDGKPGIVRAVDYRSYGARPPAADRASPGAASSLDAGRGGRVMLLVIDDLSMRPGQMAGFRAAAARMLDALDLDDLVGVATTSGLGPVVMPTRDRAAVRAALEDKTIVGQYTDSTAPFYISVVEGLEINRTASHVAAVEGAELTRGTTPLARLILRECLSVYADRRASKNGQIDETCEPRIIRAAVSLGENTIRRTEEQLSALVQLIRLLGRAPAPRVLVMLSAGIAAGVDTTSLGELGDVSLAAARAGVQFYAVTEVAESTEGADLTFERAAIRREEGAFLSAGVQTVAENAGGDAFKVIGQADRFFDRIVRTTSGVYQLGVEMPALPARDFIGVKVSTRRPGVTVRANANALSPAAGAAAPPVDEALRVRIAQGGAAPGVPVDVSTAVRRSFTGPRIQLALDVSVPLDVPGPLKARLAVVDHEGHVVAEDARPVSQPSGGGAYRLSLALALDPGPYRVRVAIADNRGNIGSAELAVDARLQEWPGLLSSQLLTSWSGADGTARMLRGGVLPQEADTLRVALELYPERAAQEPLVVRLALVPDANPAGAVERDLPATPKGAMQTISANLPAASLAAGAYTIRATVLKDGAPLGVLSTHVMKGGR